MQTGANARYCALLYGHDDMLLKTRGWLLNTIDCGSCSARNLREYQHLVLRPTINIIVVCQTMSYLECEAAAAFAVEAHSHAQILVVFVRQLACTPEQGGVMFDSAAGPAAFLHTARHMLAKPMVLASA